MIEKPTNWEAHSSHPSKYHHTQREDLTMRRPCQLKMPVRPSRWMLHGEERELAADQNGTKPWCPSTKVAGKRGFISWNRFFPKQNRFWIVLIHLQMSVMSTSAASPFAWYYPSIEVAGWSWDDQHKWMRPRMLSSIYVFHAKSRASIGRAG